MEVIALDDGSAFDHRAGALLRADEARHNLMLAIVNSLRERPDAYPDFHLWIAEDGGESVVAAMMTPPFNLLLSKPRVEGAIDALARFLHRTQVSLPGVTAAVPEARAFVEAWEALTGSRARRAMAQGIYELRKVRPVAGVPGFAREATMDHYDLVLAWIRAFSEEATAERQEDPDRTPEFVRTRLRKESGGAFLWEDGRPVSLVGYGGFTERAARIGPVYTPPPFRRHGYAGALTAAVSAWVLDQGRRSCFLYTDLDNPTSNHIYRDVGYEPVCESEDYRFSP